MERLKFNIPELPHNLNTLLDLTEEEIFKTDREVRHLKDQNEALKNEEQRISEDIAENRDELLRLEEVEQLVGRFSSFADGSSLDECKKLFLKLLEEYEAEYKMYGLDALAIPIVLPKIKRYFLEWDPLNPEQIFYGYSMMSGWKELLGDAKGAALFKHFDNNSSTLPAFDYCIWHGWMPNIRKAALEWSPRSNGPVMISLVQKWTQIIPGWILENLLEQVLIPRIREQIDLWDPTTDTVPIESWLLPWHSEMGDRLLPAYASVRQKLAKGLRNWYPGDRSAIECIRPWKDVFSAGILQAFIGMHILPKLEKALQSVDLSSTDHFDRFEIFDWLDFIGGEPIGKVLANSFFPRYYDYLRVQLGSPMLLMQELERIKKDYMNWKNIFPQEILSQQVIMAELKRALVLIGQAQARLTGASIPGMHLRQPVHPPSRLPPPHFSVPPINAPFVQLPPTNFKQLVESTAVTNGIQFFPQRSKFQDGKQVYMFGIHSIYIDGTMLFQYNPPKRQWLPVSLNQLIEMSKG
uniref:GCFC domain-containing protein n=1 Tax=Globodera pallida TaxID=36090 RepID=A0A183CHX8_GLOPA